MPPKMGNLPMINVRHVAATALALLVSLPALASPELARSKNCVACHHPERKMIGPAYKAIAERYAKDDSATKTLTEKVIKGGAGNWGQTPMPPQATVSPADAEVLVKWILSQQ
ncbi:MAG TPA: c-type cytochrome [Salinarimonas sp.]|jgi:cytochrome c|nr:c-type cytochrome [Salinarimonas sp.]